MEKEYDGTNIFALSHFLGSDMDQGDGNGRQEISGK